jgi:hypothetical protein
MVGGVSGDQLGLIPGNVAGDGLTVLAALETVIGAVGALPDNAELTGLQTVDLSHLLKEGMWGLFLSHGGYIY